MASATDSYDGLIGRTIAGKFVIESHLGGGAMGDVFLAKHATLDAHVALKVMREDLAKDSRFAERFHREAKAASKLNHPNSVHVIDFGQEPDGTIYIAMEYLRGRDLLRVLNEDWPLAPARIASVLAQALSALGVAHEQGIIHRDLKPENIMVLASTDDEGNAIDAVKVCDFGIAKMSDSRSFTTEKGQPALTQTGSLIGTPEYMSPEQARGDTLDARSDLYSVGVVLYQLLCGELPFTAENALGVVLKVVTDEPKPPSQIRASVHPGLEAVCRKAMQKTRSERYQTAKEMRVALRNAVGRATLGMGVDSISEPIAYLMPSSTPNFDAPREHISNAPTVDVTGVASGAPGSHAISNLPPSSGASGAGPGGTRPLGLSLEPKDTSAGTALASVQPRRSNMGFVGAGAIFGLLAIIGAVALINHSRASHSTASANPSASIETELLPSESSQPFAAPLPLSSDTSDSTKPATKTPVVTASTSHPRNASTASTSRAPIIAPTPLPSSTTPSATASLSATLAALPPSTPQPAFDPKSAHTELGMVNVTNVKSGPIRQVFQQAHAQLNACYKSALVAAGRRVDGSATLNLSIDGTGLISGAIVTGLDQLPQAASCFQAAVFQKRVPVSALEEGGSGATAEVWVTLRPE